MHGSGKVYLGLILLFAVAFYSQTRRVGPAGETQEKLRHFDGTIGYGRPNRDPVMQDLFVRASYALRDGDAAVAEQLYRVAVSKYPDDESTYEALGATLYFQSRYAEASAEYHKALSINARSAEALYGLGSVAYELRKYEEARDYLLGSLEVKENEADTHRVLAFVYDAMREPANAAVHLERTLELNPSIPPDDYVRKRLKELKR
jgi:tetratricopeptide (TPR) repeat protein